jgi:hypothetical protein
MTAPSQSTRRKLSLLQLAEELGNVSKACRIMGYHRDTFYEVRRAFQSAKSLVWSRSSAAPTDRIQTGSPRRWRRGSWPSLSSTRPTDSNGLPMSFASRG